MKAENLNKFKEYADIKMPKSAIFEVLGITKDPDNNGRRIIPLVSVRPYDRIIVDGEPRDIAAIERVDHDNEVVFDSNMIFSPANHGRIFLSANNPADHARYKFLTLTNYNVSNPNRNQDVPAVFRFVDDEKEAKDKLKEKQSSFESMELFFNLKDDEIVTIASLVGLGGEKSVAKLSLSEWVKDNPSKFSKIVNSIKNVVVEVGLIQYGLDNGILINNEISKEVCYGPEKNKVVFAYSEELDLIEFGESLKSNNPEIVKGLKLLSKK